MDEASCEGTQLEQSRAPTRNPSEVSDEEEAVVLVKRKTTRVRARDGKVVPKSSPQYHWFKIFKKELKKAKLGSPNHTDDMPTFSVKHVDRWIGMRRYAASQLTKQLLESKTIDGAVAKFITTEIEVAHGALSVFSGEFAGREAGSIAVWVILLAQQAKALGNNGLWTAKTQEEIDKWSIDGLLDVIQNGTIRLSDSTEMMFKDAAEMLEIALVKWRSYPWAPQRECALRDKVPSAAILLDEIKQLKPAALVQETSKETQASTSDTGAATSV